MAQPTLLSSNLISANEKTQPVKAHEYKFYACPGHDPKRAGHCDGPFAKSGTVYLPMMGIGNGILKAQTQ